jgi:hypothetical protein
MFRILGQVGDGSLAGKAASGRKSLDGAILTSNGRRDNRTRTLHTARVVFPTGYFGRDDQHFARPEPGIASVSWTTHAAIA